MYVSGAIRQKPRHQYKLVRLRLRLDKGIFDLQYNLKIC
jgi:hypothetical protein